jgi:hypothetical protein
MTRQEVYDYIVAQLVVPVNQVSKILNSFSKILDFIGDSTINNTIIPDWTNALTFNADGSGAGKFCLHPDNNGKKRIFQSKVNGNINHQPPVDPNITEDAYWIEISQSTGSAIKEWASGLYGAGLILVYHNHSAGTSGIYKLVNPTRPYASANIETEINAGDWEQVVPLECIVLDTTTAPIVINGHNHKQLSYKGSAPINANKTWQFSNFSKLRFIPFIRVNIGTANVEQTFPNTVKSDTNQADWTAATFKWKPANPGDYELSFTNDGAAQVLKIYGPL